MGRRPRLGSRRSTEWTKGFRGAHAGDLDESRRSEAQRIDLYLGSVLARGEERAVRPVPVLVEEVVNEVRGERDQVGGEDSGREGGRDDSPESTREPAAIRALDRE